MTDPALLEACKKFVAEHPYSLKRAPETFAGELAEWASALVAREVRSLRVAVESYEERHAEFEKSPSKEGLDLVNAERGAIVDAALALIRSLRSPSGGGA